MRWRVFYFFLLSLLLPLASAVEIAFFVRTRPDGTIEVYEEGTLFSHVAIRVGDQWLEAHPYYGVHLTQSTSNMGSISKIYSDASIPEPGQDFLDKVLGKKYFLFADWYDPEVFNCTKLVALYLGIDPNPMSFDPLIWGDRFHEYLGKPGLSLLEIETELQDRAFEATKVSGCRASLL